MIASHLTEWPSPSDEADLWLLSLTIDFGWLVVIGSLEYYTTFKPLLRSARAEISITLGPGEAGDGPPSLTIAWRRRIQVRANQTQSRGGGSMHCNALQSNKILPIWNRKKKEIWINATKGNHTLVTLDRFLVACVTKRKLLCWVVSSKYYHALSFSLFIYLCQSSPPRSSNRGKASMRTSTVSWWVGIRG